MSLTFQEGDFMALFGRHVDVEGKSTDFYENYVLNPKVGEKNVGTVFAEVVKKNLSEADSKLTELSVTRLSEEIAVLRFELFGLAWAHKYVSGVKVVSQGNFNKQFLEQKDRQDIWE